MAGSSAIFKDVRRRLFLVAGALLFVAGAAILTVGLIGYFNEDEPSFSADTDGDPFRYPANLQEVENLPVAVPYYNPQREVIQPTPTPTPEPVFAAPLRLIVDSIGVDATVATYGLDSEGIPIVPTGSDAGEIVAWYDFSAMPGEGSNSVLAAHVTWNKRGAVFYSLDEVQEGDTIRVVDQDDREFVYEVFANFAVDPFDPDSLQVMSSTDEDIVTLITCGGNWVPDPAERFGGNYTDRTIVQARLVEPSVTAPAVPAEISQG